MQDVDKIITFPILGDWFQLDVSNYFTVFGFKIYYYGVIIAIGFLLAIMYIMRRSNEFGLTQDNSLDMLIFAVPIAIVSARLFFVFFDWGNSDKYINDPIKIITGIRDGGVAIYGGVIGGVLGAALCSKIKKIDFFSFADLAGLGLLIGQSIGRWGNFINRELYGSETTLPWRMGLTGSDGITTYYHPCFLYESIWNAVGFLLLHFYSKKVGRKYPGQIFVLYLGWYGLGRAWIETVRLDVFNLFLFGIPVDMLIAILCAVGAVIVNLIMLRRGKQGA